MVLPGEHRLFTGEDCVFCFCWMEWSGWFIVLFKSSISLLIFCLLILLLKMECWSLKLSVELCLSPFHFASFGFMYFGALFLDAYMLYFFHLLDGLTLSSIYNVLFVFYNSFASPALSVTIYMGYFFILLLSPFCVFVSKQVSYRWHTNGP